MVRKLDAVDDRVAQIHIARFHVNLCPERIATFRELALAHTAEKVETFFFRPISPGAVFAPRCQSAAVFSYFLRGLFADKGKALFNQFLRALIDLFEKIGGVEKTLLPVITEPVNIVLDGAYKGLIFFDGIRIVHAEIAQPVEDLGHAKVNDNGFCVTDVKKAVGFGWKACVDRQSIVTTTGTHVLLDHVAYEMVDFVIGGDLFFRGDAVYHTGYARVFVFSIVIHALSLS